MPRALLFSDAFSGRFWGLLEFSPFQSEPLYPNGAVVKIIGALGQTPLLTWQFPYHPKGASYFYTGVPRSGLGRRGPFPVPLYPVTMSLSWSKPLLSPPKACSLVPLPAKQSWEGHTLGRLPRIPVSCPKRGQPRPGGDRV